MSGLQVYAKNRAFLPVLAVLEGVLIVRRLGKKGRSVVFVGLVES
ncbi:MAG: hypothetical protein S4CHLAM107_11850 [Chlamydiia bacterium]|nr:hypothetical protein [Chlamydiia bacterium]